MMSQITIKRSTWLLVLLQLACGGSDTAAPGPARPLTRIEPWEYDCAGSSEVICPGESIQGKVTAAPAGTAFTIKAGVHRRQRVAPKNGNSFTGEPGAILDGEGVTQFAFEGGATGVLIKDLEITNYIPGDILGAVQGYDARDWILENLNVHHNTGMGANLRGRFTVRGGSYHHNTKLGIGVNEGAGALLEGVELSYNNPNSAFDPLWEAGGIKIVLSDQVTVRGCHVHHNVGPGIWFDVGNQRSSVINNLVTDNTHAGIFYEISYSGVIQGNTVSNNGSRIGSGDVYGAGILVSASRDVEVHGNTLRGNADGVVGLQENRGVGRLGPYIVQNLWVHDNDVSLILGASGLVDLIGDGALHDRNNRFDLNHYDVTDNGRPFWIEARTRISPQDWQARGQDQTSTFTGPSK